MLNVKFLFRFFVKFLIKIMNLATNNVSQQQNCYAEINCSTVDPTARILANGSQSEIIAELERLEQQNAEFNKIQGIDDLFIHHDRSDNDLLDEMVAEFGLEFPDFDIFNYVDPALNVMLDDSAAEVLNKVDCDILQPDINLNSLSSEAIATNTCAELALQKKLTTEQGEELQLLRGQVQKQQEMISEMQKQLNNFMAIRQTNPSQESLQEDECQQEIERVPLPKETTQSLELVQSKTIDACILTADDQSIAREYVAVFNDSLQNQKFQSNFDCVLDHMDEINVISRSDDLDHIAATEEAVPMEFSNAADCDIQFPKLILTQLSSPNPLNNPTAIHQMNSQKSLEEVDQESMVEERTPEIRSTIADADVRIVTENSLDSSDGQSNALELGHNPVTAEQCNGKRVVTHPSDDDEGILDVVHPLQEEAPLERPPFSNDGDQHLEVDSLNQKQVRQNQKRKFCRIRKGESYRSSASSIGRGKQSKMHSCEVCHERCVSNSQLIIHRRIHTGEKPYKCRVCDASFSRKYRLSRHLMIHTGEKPFECDICQKVFREKRTLSDHMNIHSGNKPYACNVCKKSFKCRSKFRRHVKLHVKKS